MYSDYKSLLIAITSFIAGCIISRITPINDVHSQNNNLNMDETIQKVEALPTQSEEPTIPTPAPIIEEIIPPKLYTAAFTPNRLRFNVTRSMLRRSRPIIGNTDRLHAYIQKLHSKQCTVILFLGGSITDGHNVKGGSEQAYPKFLLFWLNARYPCVNDDGTAGRHEMKKTHAQNSQTHFIHWSMVGEIERVDLVFVEFNVNDAFIPNLAHALEDKSDMAKINEYTDLWYSEVLLRRLLLLRKPDPIAIVTFNADYIGTTWATFPPFMDPQEARQTLFRHAEEPMKLFISAMYEIPVFSASIWMLPLASKMGTAWQFNRTHNPYSTAWWHTDKCCHPNAEGHKVLSLVLAYCIVEEEKVLLAAYNDSESVERDMTMDGLLRDPIYLSPEEDSVYVQNAAGNNTIDIDFTDPKGEEIWKDFVVTNDGWEWYADNKDKDKFGFIANQTGAHIAISVSGWKKIGLVEVSFVMSYENFGVSLAWIDSDKSNLNDRLCRDTKKHGNLVDAKWLGFEKLIAIWNEPASVPTVQMLRYRLSGEETAQFLHVCLTPRNAIMKGTENKFKLLGVRLY